VTARLYSIYKVGYFLFPLFRKQIDRLIGRLFILLVLFALFGCLAIEMAGQLAAHLYFYIKLLYKSITFM